jgi:hypothetical protein
MNQLVNKQVKEARESRRLAFESNLTLFFAHSFFDFRGIP